MQKGSSSIYLVVALVLLVIVGAGYLLTKNSPPQVNQISPTSLPSPTDLIQSNIDDAIDYQIPSGWRKEVHKNTSPELKDFSDDIYLLSPDYKYIPSNQRFGTIITIRRLKDDYPRRSFDLILNSDTPSVKKSARRVTVSGLDAVYDRDDFEGSVLQYTIAEETSGGSYRWDIGMGLSGYSATSEVKIFDDFIKSVKIHSPSK